MWLILLYTLAAHSRNGSLDLEINQKIEIGDEGL